MLGVKVPGRAMVASILEGMASIAAPNDPLKILYQGISYKPFISLFRMTGAIDAHPQLAGIGESILLILVTNLYAQLCVTIITQ